MLRLVQVGNALPHSFIVDPAAEFMSGSIAQLTTMGNNIVCGLSNGSAPIGIIDDVKTSSFWAPSIDEVVIAPLIAGVRNSANQLVTPNDIKVELRNPNVRADSFTSNVDVELNWRNGVITFLAGSVLNYDMDGDGTPDSLRAVVSYQYQIPNMPGDDSTIGSGRVSVWFMRGIFESDCFDTSQRYPLNASLFCNSKGQFSTKQEDPNFPGVAIVTAPPGGILSTLQFLWL